MKDTITYAPFYDIFATYKDLTYAQKVLYAYILALSRIDGYAKASNAYLAKRIGMPCERWLRTLLSDLAHKGYIRCEGERKGRKIFPLKIPLEDGKHPDQIHPDQIHPDVNPPLIRMENILSSGCKTSTPPTPPYNEEKKAIRKGEGSAQARDPSPKYQNSPISTSPPAPQHPHLQLFRDTEHVILTEAQYVSLIEDLEDRLGDGASDFVKGRIENLDKHLASSPNHYKGKHYDTLKTWCQNDFSKFLPEKSHDLLTEEEQKQTTRESKIIKTEITNDQFVKNYIYSNREQGKKIIKNCHSVTIWGQPPIELQFSEQNFKDKFMDAVNPLDLALNSR